MATKKTQAATKKPTRRGRPKTKQRRLGKHEKRVVGKILATIRKFTLTAADANSIETAINKRLIADLKLAVSAVTNAKIPEAKLVGERFRPECSVVGTGAHKLLAVECKLLKGTTNRPKSLFKEGIAQALLYLRIYKVAVLVLYDLTPTGVYAQAFAPGNRTETQFAGLLRRELALHIIVLKP